MLGFPRVSENSPTCLIGCNLDIEKRDSMSGVHSAMGKEDGKVSVSDFKKRLANRWTVRDSRYGGLKGPNTRISAALYAVIEQPALESK
jgi:hypothetical protein